MIRKWIVEAFIPADEEMIKRRVWGMISGAENFPQVKRRLLKIRRHASNRQRLLLRKGKYLAARNMGLIAEHANQFFRALCVDSGGLRVVIGIRLWPSKWNDLLDKARQSM